MQGEGAPTGAGRAQCAGGRRLPPARRGALGLERCRRPRLGSGARSASGASGAAAPPASPRAGVVDCRSAAGLHGEQAEAAPGGKSERGGPSWRSARARRACAVAVVRGMVAGAQDDPAGRPRMQAACTVHGGTRAPPARAAAHPRGWRRSWSTRMARSAVATGRAAARPHGARRESEGGTKPGRGQARRPRIQGARAHQGEREAGASKHRAGQRGERVALASSGEAGHRSRPRLQAGLDAPAMRRRASPWLLPRALSCAGMTRPSERASAREPTSRASATSSPVLRRSGPR
jgi:hypothetical protein